MRTESDLHAAFALLERDGDAYLVASAPRLPAADEPAHEVEQRDPVEVDVAIAQCGGGVARVSFGTV